MKGKIPISEIVVDNDLYPRVATFWQTIYKYSEMMKAGAKFPPIVVAVLNNRKILVDGRHRLEARKLLKEDKINAEINFGWDRKKILEEAIKMNNSHGLSLSPYELRRIALKLRSMKYKDSEISSLIRVPIGKLQTFVSKRAVNVITGKPLDVGESAEQIIIKSPIKHLAGETLGLEQIQIIEDSQVLFAAKNQVSLLGQVVTLLENNMINTNDKKVLELIDRIKELINKI